MDKHEHLGNFSEARKNRAIRKEKRTDGGYHSVSTSAGKEEGVGGFEADQHLSPSKKERTVGKPVSALIK